MRTSIQAVLIFCTFLVALCQPATADTIDTHTVVLDGGGKLMSWFMPQDQAYGHVAKLSADFIKAAMVGPIDPANGLPVIYTHSEYKQADFTGSGWPNNPAGKHAMLADSMMLYYQYSGDSAVLDAVKALLDFQLRQFADDGAHPLGGTTPATYHWASVPWSCGAAGDIHYGTDGYSDGRFMIEPDKVGELGFHGYLSYFQITGDTRYRDAAIACADALASHIRTGSATQSPWPFKVDARNNQLGSTPEDYCAHVIAPIRLFDELIRLNLGNGAAYQAARATAWNWMMTYPMANNVWANYFEDDTPQANNLWNTNQYDPGQTARYLLEHPELDANWETHVAGLLNYIETEFGFTDPGESGAQYGPILISEQKIYTFKMGSHTSRFGAVSALYAERTGDATAKEKAFRSLNWCTYMARNNGSVMEGPKEAIQNPPFWFTDGHGDYIRHFMLAMGAFPEWAPAGENHILRSTSVVKSVTYANTSISYSTFDAASTETLRIAGGILSITANGSALPARPDLNAEGYTFNNGVLKVRHDAATNIVINFDPALVPPNISLSVSGTLVAPANVTLSATASHPNGVTKVEFFEGANKLGESAAAPYSIVWRNVPAGSFTVSARATGTNGLTASSASTVVITSPTAATNVGNTSEGTTTDYITDGSGAYINACRFVASADQQLTIIKAKVDAITGKYQCAIYSDSGGNASALLRATNELTPAANGWQTFTLTAPLQATNGTAYWLAIWSNDVNARVHADNGGTERFAAYPYGTWPNPVNLTGNGGFTYCMYATGPGKTAFQQWKANNGLPDATSPNSDDDHDGSPLLVEYALGSDPGAGDPPTLWNVGMSGGQLTLTYSKAKAATDITVLAEVSGDLVNWSSNAIDVDQQWQFLDGTTLQTITARDLAPSPPATRRFIRVRVTGP